MTSYAPGDSPEAFLSTTEHFDKDTDQSMDKLNNVYTDIAKQVNSKEIARYELTEILTGQQFFDPSDTQKRRATYRKCYTFGAIVSGGGLGIPHGLLALRCILESMAVVCGLMAISPLFLTQVF